MRGRGPANLLRDAVNTRRGQDGVGSQSGWAYSHRSRTSNDRLHFPMPSAPARIAHPYRHEALLLVLLFLRVAGRHMAQADQNQCRQGDHGDDGHVSSFALHRVLSRREMDLPVRFRNSLHGLWSDAIVALTLKISPQDMLSAAGRKSRFLTRRSGRASVAKAGRFKEKSRKAAHKCNQ